VFADRLGLSNGSTLHKQSGSITACLLVVEGLQCVIQSPNLAVGVSFPRAFKFLSNTQMVYTAVVTINLKNDLIDS